MVALSIVAVTLVSLLAALAAVAFLHRRARRDRDAAANEIDALRREVSRLQKDVERVGSSSVTGVIHDVRSLMTIVVGMGDLLAERTRDLDDERHLDVLRGASQQMIELLGGAMDVVRVDESDGAAGDFDLRELCDELVALFEARASFRGLALELEVDRRVPGRVVGDRVRLRRVLTNLVANAVEYTARGRVVVAARTEGGDGRSIRFEVGDTGPGLAAEDLARLVKPFERGSGVRAEGFGLGLAIAKALVASMGGTLSAESALGAGTTFSFTLRLPRAPGHTTLTPRDAVLRGRRAVVVHDRAPARDSLRSTLEGWGIVVDSAPSMAQALEMAGGRPGADAILVEAGPPDGWSQRITPLAGAAPVPVIAFVTDLAYERRADLHELGVKVVLAKPRKRDDLRLALVQLFSSDQMAAPVALADGTGSHPVRVR